MDLIYFFGRFHVLALHLPIALILIVVLVEFLARREKYRYLNQSVPFLWSATAVTAVATAILGYMHFSEGVFTGPSAVSHRALGTSVAVVSVIAWLLRTQFEVFYKRIQPFVGVVLVVLVVLTGHYGGNLTHGDTYLVQYAPQPLRRLAGLESAHERVTDIALADPYLDVVKPIIDRRCATCHNNDKKRGQLALTTYDAMLAGGKDGPVIEPGKDGGELLRRISLPHDNKDFMPADGKTPLTEDETAIMRWWIVSGAKTGVNLSALMPEDNVKKLISAELTGKTEASQVANSEQPAIQADQAIVDAIAKSGLLVRQVSLTDPRLVVSTLAPGFNLTEAQAAALEHAADQIVELDLYRIGLQDSFLQNIGQFSKVEKLRVDKNALTDSGILALKGLTKLEMVNLYGNVGVTDKSIETLAQMPALKRIYVAATGVTPAGANKLRQLKEGLIVFGPADTDIATSSGPAPGQPRGK